MGIRFACPNGHPLHVKAELAGKRGICPVCEVRLVVPSPHGSPPAAASVPAAQASAAEPDNKPASRTPSQPQAQPQAAAGMAPEPPAGPSQPEPQTRSAATEQPQWYVRPASGGQFGPADDTLVRQWAAEGRVGPDAYVWRTGWPEWRLATNVPDYFPQLTADQAAARPSLPAAYNTTTLRPGGSPSPPADVSQATARYQRRKQRSARSQMLAAIVLLVLVLVLAGVLIWVIRQTSGGASPAPTPTSPAAQPGEEVTIDPADDEPVAADDAPPAGE